MLLDYREQKEKEFLKIQNRINEIRKMLRELPSVPLDEPYQKGWILIKEFRNDIKNRSDYPLLKKLYDMCVSEAYTLDVNIVRYYRRGEKLSKRYFGKNQNRSIPYPQFHPIHKKQFDKLEEHEQKYFVPHHTYKNLYTLSFPQYYTFIKVKPNIITHTKIKGGKLEQELSYFEEKSQQLVNEGYSNWGNYYGSYPKKHRHRDKQLIKEFVKGKTDDIVLGKIGKEYKY